MSVLKCKMCGGKLDVTSLDKIVKCDFCGTSQTVPTIDEERKAGLFNRAVQLRLANEFDRAAAVYDSIIGEFPAEAEAYWGLVLCKYGIEYVDDPPTGLKLPTCHRTYYDNIFSDINYLKAIENADVVAREMYQNEAYIIDEIQKMILSIASNEAPFDIFISCKDSDDTGTRTKDSVLAQEIYYALTNEGYNVFFSRITLEDKPGTQYEPYIFAALSSAKIMIVVGTKPEYFNAVWVKNEWQRFLELMKTDKTRTIIPAYRDMDAYDLPDRLAVYQAQDMSRLAFMQDLVRGINKLHSRTVSDEGSAAEIPLPADTLHPEILKLLKRINICIENNEIGSIESYCNKILDIDPDFGEALCLKKMTRYEKSVYKVRDWDDTAIVGDYITNADKTRIIGFIRTQTDIKIPDGIEYLGCLPFYSIPELESVEIPDDTAADPDVFMFCGCDMLKNIKLPSNLRRINDNAFNGCTVLKQIDIPENVEYIGEYAFYGCAGLEGIDLPDRLNDIGYSVFGGCSALKTIKFPPDVTSVDAYAFYGCSTLENIVLPSKLKDIGEHAFDECSGLRAITVPDNVTEIRDYCFQDCFALESVFLPSGLEKIGMWAFRNCRSLTEIHIPSGVKRIDEGTFNGCTSLKSADIPKGITSIALHAFNGCTMLENISLPACIDEMGRTAFDNCPALKITIPDSALDRLIEKDKTSIGMWFDRVIDPTTDRFLAIRGEQGVLLTSDERKFRDRNSKHAEMMLAEKKKRTAEYERQLEALKTERDNAVKEISMLGIFGLGRKIMLNRRIDELIKEIDEVKFLLERLK